MEVAWIIRGKYVIREPFIPLLQTSFIRVPIFRNEMNTDLLAAGIIGFTPAVVLLYYTLKDYTYPKVEKPFFDDRKAFGLFAIGLIVGTIFSAVESWFSLKVVMVALTLALMEELVKLVILNLPRFQGKLDTSFYGTTLGLGIGATMGFGAFYSTKIILGSLDPMSIVILIIIAFQFIFLHGSTGTALGIGVARRMLAPYFARAALVHIAYNLLMIPFFSGDQMLGYLLFFIVTGILAFYYYRICRLELNQLVEEEILKFESRKERNT